MRVLQLGRGISPINFRIKSKLALVTFDVHFDCAGSHKMCVRVLDWFWSAAFYL